MTQFLHRLCRIMALFGGVLLAIVVVITVINVGGFLLNAIVRSYGGYVSGLPGYEEAAALLVGVAMSLMLPYTQLARAHVSVDLFTNALSPRHLRFVTRATDLLAAVIAALLAITLIDGAHTAASDNLTTQVLELPEAPFRYVGVLGLAVWSVVAFWLFLNPDAAAPAQDDDEDADNDRLADGEAR